MSGQTSAADEHFFVVCVVSLVMYCGEIVDRFTVECENIKSSRCDCLVYFRALRAPGQGRTGAILVTLVTFLFVFLSFKEKSLFQKDLLLR